MSIENNNIDLNNYLGKKVIHNPEGVCVITDIADMDSFTKEKHEYLKLIPVIDKSATVYVPLGAIHKNIRALRSKKEILNIITQSKKLKANWDNNEQRRKTEGQRALQCDDGLALAMLVKSYNKRKNEKPLSVSDKSCLKKAEQFLCSEIAEVLGVDYQKALSYIIDDDIII